jgi:hypothetical protein
LEPFRRGEGSRVDPLGGWGGRKNLPHAGLVGLEHARRAHHRALPRRLHRLHRLPQPVHLRTKPQTSEDSEEDLSSTHYPSRTAPPPPPPPLFVRTPRSHLEKVEHHFPQPVELDRRLGLRPPRPLTPRNPPPPRAEAVTGQGAERAAPTCAQCTVGTWVGATVGRGGGRRPTCARVRQSTPTRSSPPAPAPAPAPASAALGRSGTGASPGIGAVVTAPTPAVVTAPTPEPSGASSSAMTESGRSPCATPCATRAASSASTAVRRASLISRGETCSPTLSPLRPPRPRVTARARPAAVGRGDLCAGPGFVRGTRVCAQRTGGRGAGAPDVDVARDAQPGPPEQPHGLTDRARVQPALERRLKRGSRLARARPPARVRQLDA